MPPSNHLLDDILSYVVIEIGTLFSLLTISLILANWRILSNIYARLMLLVQVSHMFACLVDSYYYEDDESGPGLLLCQIGGALFYFFWLISNFLSELMLLLVFLDLRNYRSSRCHKPFLFLIASIVALSAIIAFLPMKSYRKCKIGDYPTFCGWCDKESSNGNNGEVGWLIYAVPVACGLVLFFMFVYQVVKVKKQGRNRLTRQQKEALNVVFIPTITIFFIVLNTVVTYVDPTVQPQSFSSHLLILLTQLVFLTPMVNHIFFVRFITKLEDISELRINRCRWMLLCSKQRQGRDIYNDDAFEVEDIDRSRERRPSQGR